MHAASTVIGKPIKSVYPVVNGPIDMNIKILNTTFKPRGSRSRHDITIMWSGGNTIGSSWKPCHCVPLIPHTVFLSVDKLYRLASTQTPTYTCIPPGVKQNVYFVIDDTSNRQRRLLKKCSEYPDDCGAWRQGGNSTKPAYFIRSAQNSLHFVTYRAGIYGNMSKGNFVPLDLQPDPSTIVVAYRKYSISVRNSSYKKRVTWFYSKPNLKLYFFTMLK
jgi:hypothetical protein